jgi:hypothetical protein
MSDVILKVYKCMNDDEPGERVGEGVVRLEVAMRLLCESLNPVMALGLGAKLVDMSASTISIVQNSWNPMLLGDVSGVPSTGRHYYVLRAMGDSPSDVMTGVTPMDQLQVLVAAHVDAWGEKQPEVYSCEATSEAFEVLVRLDRLIGHR